MNDPRVTGPVCRPAEPEEVSKLSPRKQDAIHRALLSGLLGNVGARVDGSEYSGVRGRKFHLFPGSSLFRRRPPWVMAAELVETTKLYARTVASIHPLWIERMAAHLVKRTFSDPHWNPSLGRVLAFEKVALQGLTLVPRRGTHYGPIEPGLSREIFIHHALVLGEYATDAPFFIHNRRLIEQVQALEAKSRRRDVLVDPKARFAFYDARIPRRIYTSDEFEKWRRLAERRNPRLLFMGQRDLMLHPALGITEELYPDSIQADGVALPLEYRFEPGDRADGITVTLPLAALNQVAPEPFDWLVPGFRAELFTALIRTLPKALRVRFIPAPEFASRAARDLTPSCGPVLDALAHYLGKASGEAVSRESFQPEALLAYLRMNYRVVDAGDKEVAMGRDLGEIRRRLGLQARARFAASPPPGYHRDDLTRWDFGDLPERIEIEHDGLTLNGYPALVDAIRSVSLRLFDSPEAAVESMRGGLRRLFMLQLGQEMRHVERAIVDLDRLCLYYATVGRCDDLKDDLLLAIADRAFFDDRGAGDVRTRDAFVDRAAAGWCRLSSASDQVTQIVAELLDAYHEVAVALASDFPPLWGDSARDMRDQLVHLIYPGFIIRTPSERLRHVPRYLRALGIRLHKLGNAGLSRDQQAMSEVQPLWDRYKLRAARDCDRATRDPALQQYRWMVEELRVSLFAQELKAASPVSAARLLRQWATIRD